MPALGVFRPTVHRATTRQMAALLPFHAPSGLGGRGVYIGRDVSGAPFCYDPFDLYTRGLISGPAMVVLGEIGRGKSSFVKSYIHRQVGVFGRRCVVVSPKPREYDPLCDALGARPVRLVPGGGGVNLNPLDARGGSSELQLRALRSVAAATLARPLLPPEDAALAQTLRTLTARTVPTLPMIVTTLLDPPESAWRGRWDSRAQWRAETRFLALGLDRFVVGDARGMFDASTTPGVSLDAALVLIDLSAVADSSAIAILITAALSWIQAAIAAESDAHHAKRILVVDEAWRVLANLAAAEALMDTVKHSRAYGVQTITITHRVGDLQAAGDEGTRVSRIAQGLLSDAETKVVFAQSHDQVAVVRDRLGLSATEAAILPRLGRGEALWRVGTRSFLVLHRRSTLEEQITNTDARMRPGASP